MLRGGRGESLPRRVARRAEPAVPLVRAVDVELAAATGERPRLAQLPAGRRLLEQPGDALVCALLYAAARRVWTEQPADWAPQDVRDETARQLLRLLTGRKLPIDADDVDLLVELALEARIQGFWLSTELLAPVLRVAERHARAHGVSEIRPSLDDLRRAVERGVLQARTRQTLQARLDELLGAGEAVDIHPTLLGEGDGFGRRTRASIVAAWGRAPGVARLIQELAGISGTQPSAAWRQRVAERLDAVADGPRFLRMMLEEALATDDLPVERWGSVRVVWLTDENAELVRAAAWAAAVARPPWAATVLGRLAEHAAAHLPGHEPQYRRSLKVATACVRVLAELGEDGLAELVRLEGRVKHSGVRREIDRALTVAATRAGVTSAQLRAGGVPTFGLGDHGRRETAVGPATAVVSVAPPGRVEVVWRLAGRESSSPPRALRAEHAEAIKALQAELREIRGSLEAERRRLEQLLADGASWSCEDWEGLYLRHPLVGAIAGRLLWRLTGASGEVVVGMAATGERLLALDGGSAPAEIARVELWHPLHGTAVEVAEWRELLAERELRQPFKQAHREVYRPSADEESRISSARFAGHVLRYDQAYALMKGRGWSGQALGPWDGGYDTVMKRAFEAQGIEVELEVEYLDTDEPPSLCRTGEARFFPRRSPSAVDAVPLAKVPPVVFSEAMRDIDLFVTAASIAGDPTWPLRVRPLEIDYWQTNAFAPELSESGATRRDVLRQILPRLPIAERCEVTDLYLVVRGDLRTYKVHLGTGNVLMEPVGKPLHVLPGGRAGTAPNVAFLPFDGDELLTVILSKASLLARDAEIADESFREQLRL